jgi:hypothetical protein
MEFKDFAQNEASALLERLTSAAHAATQKVREDFEAQIARMRDEAQKIREQLEAETARAAAVETDLDTVIEAHKTVDGERLKAEEEVRTLREMLDKARAEIKQLEEVLETEMAQKAVLELEAAKKGVLEADLTAARTSIDTLRAAQQTQEATIRQLESKLAQLQAAENSLRKQSGDTAGLLQTLTAAAESATRKIREEADAEIAAMRSELDAARRRAAASSDTPGATGPTDHQPAMLTASVRALEELGKATSVTELFGAVVKQLSPRFPRVALFRVKGKHLEGERGSGLDTSTDITKLVIPMSMDSLVTRAANLGTIEDLAGSQPPAANSPVGGSPAAAIALPIRFQGETLAVVYADSEQVWDDAHSAFARLLLQHANVLLTRLTQELKTLKELRDYAGMLLQEAEQMFLADVESKRSEKERVRRLQETIACGRQLFSQRAALEGPVAAGLLDEQIEIILSTQPVTPFATDLEAAITRAHSQRTAS